MIIDYFELIKHKKCYCSIDLKYNFKNNIAISFSKNQHDNDK